MSNVQILVERNQAFSSNFTDAQLRMRPRLSTVILTCSDPRVDPAAFLGLTNGDAAVVRNAGGRVTPGVLQDLGVFGFLAPGMGDGPVPQPDFVIIHHTDCGMSRLANPEAQRALGDRLGVDASHVAALAISDPYESVRGDVQKLREIPGIAKTLRISGFVYDVSTGLMNAAD